MRAAVILGCRSTGRGETARGEIVEATGSRRGRRDAGRSVLAGPSAPFARNRVREKAVQRDRCLPGVEASRMLTPTLADRLLGSPATINALTPDTWRRPPVPHGAGASERAHERAAFEQLHVRIATPAGCSDTAQVTGLPE